MPNLYKENISSNSIYVNVRRHKIIYQGKKCILLSLRDISSSMKLD